MRHSFSTDEITQSFADVREDLSFLRTLAEENKNRLEQFRKECQKHRGHIRPDTLHNVTEWITALTGHYSRLLQTIKDKTSDIRTSPQSYETLTAVTDAKNGIADLLRSQQLLLGSVLASTDWQSPSYAHAVFSQAGRQTGSIVGTMNDYKRDQHADAKAYEEAFKKEYIDAPLKFPVNTYATVSGMAAFTTILNFLVMEKKTEGTILAGSAMYFENKLLLEAMFSNRLLFVDESDTQAVLDAITAHQPSAIFLDSLCNSPDVQVPDLPSITKYLVRTVKKETYLIIDNTGLSFFYQPIAAVFGKNRKLHCLAFESLNKYHQFGMDRVTGGIISAVGKGTGNLYLYRDNLGTNIPDTSVLSLPRPNRALLASRMMRHARNTHILAHAIEKWIGAYPDSPLEGVQYPGLGLHSSHIYARSLPFHGSFFTLSFKRRYRTIPFYKKLKKKLLSVARKRHVDIAAGTSFGLPVTRIYLTASNTDAGTPFLRVAVGTEHRCGIAAVAEVFCEAISA